MASFKADTDEARRYVGLEGSTDASTRQQVDANMLGPDVLDVKQYPTATFVVHSIQPIRSRRPNAPQQLQLNGDFTLHGTTNKISVIATPISVNRYTRLVGSFSILQSDYGIKPFRKVLGAVGVADRLTIWGDLWIGAERMKCRFVPQAASFGITCSHAMISQPTMRHRFVQLERTLPLGTRHSCFVLRHSLDIRHSAFVIAPPIPRRHEAELMDDPALDAESHLAALRGLRRINRITRSAAILWPAIARAAKEISPAPLRMLDLACGGGDNALAIAQIVHRRGLALDVHGCDISPVAIAEARRSASSLGVDPNGFFSRDVLGQALPAGYHVIMCSLFLHHLDREQATRMIRRMAEAAERIALVSDLRRTRLGLGMAWVGSRLLTRSPVVHVDAVRSVAGAFVESEVDRMVAESGLRACERMGTGSEPDRRKPRKKRLP